MIHLIKLLIGFVCLLPPRVAVGLGHVLGFMYGNVFRYRRRETAETMARCLPGSTPAERNRWLNRMYRNLALNVIEAMRLHSYSEQYLKDHFFLTGFEHMEKVMTEHGCALGSFGHTGNWELLAVMCVMTPYEGSVVVKPLKPKAFNDYVVEVRNRMGLEVIMRKQALRRVFRALKEGRMLGFVIDQNMSRSKGEFVDFFGRPACTTLGLAQISAKSRVPIVPVFMVRHGYYRHEVRMLPPVDPPADSSRESLLAVTQRLTTLIEEHIRAYPDQWTWLHRRWRTQPAPEDLEARQTG